MFAYTQSAKMRTVFHSKLLASIAVPYYSFKNGSLKKTKNSPYI